MEGFQNFNNQNFDPNSLANMTSTVIMFLVINDVSPSIQSYASNMNMVAREVFMQELKNCHRKNDIVVKTITFCENVEHKSGFMPILNLPDDYLDVAPQGRGTALYDAVLQGLEQAIQYRKDLEDQGIEVRTAIFISTDGEDNSSNRDSAKKIKQLVEDLRRNEAWVSTFTINMLGVGHASYFQNACTEMGLDHTKCLVTIGNSASEIRKQMGVVSQSVSSSSASTATVNF
jgi:uncharacterized protein YegL